MPEDAAGGGTGRIVLDDFVYDREPTSLLEVRFGWSGTVGGKNPPSLGSTGAFATLLATPCSAPFLGTAVGFALSRGAADIFLVFAFLGLGFVGVVVDGDRSAFLTEGDGDGPPRRRLAAGLLVAVTVEHLALGSAARADARPHDVRACADVRRAARGELEEVGGSLRVELPV